MKAIIKLCLLAFLVFMLSVSGTAGEKEGLGVLFKMGPVKSVGVSYELSKSTTLRATFGLDAYTADMEIHHLYITDYDHDMNKYDVSLGLLFALLKKKDLTLYGGIETGYNYGKRKFRIAPYETAGGVTPYYEEYTMAQKTNAYSGNVILGVRHKLGEKIALFGEFGLGFIRDKTTATSAVNGLESEDTVTQWNLNRSGIGVVFYL